MPIPYQQPKHFSDAIRKADLQRHLAPGYTAVKGRASGRKTGAVCQPTALQKRWIEAYLSNGLDAKAAAIKAGYSPQSAAVAGSKLLKNKSVKAALREMQGEMIQRLEITTHYKMAKLKKIMDLAVPDDAQTLRDINAGAAISAMSEHSKMVGDYAPEKSISANLHLNADMSKMLEETANLVEKYKKEY